LSGYDHFVPVTYAESPEGEFDRVGAIGAAYAVFGSSVFGECIFKVLDNGVSFLPYEKIVPRLFHLKWLRAVWKDRCRGFPFTLGCVQ